MKRRGLILLCIGILFGLIGCQGSTASENPTGLPSEIPQKVLSPVPTTQIPSDTLTPTLTNTPMPTATPIPTKKPTNTPMPTPTVTLTSTPIPFYVSEGEHAQTIMIYMVGSDLESSYAAGSYDLMEMVNAEADVEYNNIVIYTGGASQWYISGLSAEYDSILLLGRNGLSLVDVVEEQNMGNADTLAMFINYCMEHFDSETYSLVLWNHGAGPVLGYGLDEKSNDIMTLQELGTALEMSLGKQKKNLEWIGFDACLMSSMEIADVVAPYANYMVASQETEPGWGWCYIFLNALSNEVFRNAVLEKAIIDIYMYYGEIVFADAPKMYTDLTLSCIDLQKYQNAEDALNQYFAELRNTLDTETYAEVVRARSQMREFGSYSTTFQYGMVDLIGLLEKLPTSDYTESALNAVKEMIVYSCSNLDGANGVSICYPTESTEEYKELYSKVQNEIGFAEEYGKFLSMMEEIKEGESLTQSWDFAKASTSTAQKSSGDGKTCTSDIAIQLTEEQNKNFATANYTILRKMEGNTFFTKEKYPRLDEMYQKVFQGSDVTLDENGVLHAYYGNEVIYVHDLTDNVYSEVPLLLMEIERNEDESRYHVYGVLQDLSGGIFDLKIETAEIQVVVNAEYPDGVIRYVVPYVKKDELNTPAKQLLELDDFTYLSIPAPIKYFTKGNGGNMISFSEWENTEVTSGIEITLKNEFVLEKRPIDNPDNYVCVFEITDLQGNVSYSEMIPLQ